MKIPLLILVISALPISPTYAASQGDNYVGLQYSQVTYDEDDFDDAEPTALVGKIGQFLNENIAIEGRLGFEHHRVERAIDTFVAIGGDPRQVDLPGS